jgi:hypothetical protein
MRVAQPFSIFFSLDMFTGGGKFTIRPDIVCVDIKARREKVFPSQNRPLHMKEPKPEGKQHSAGEKGVKRDRKSSISRLALASNKMRILPSNREP